MVKIHGISIIKIKEKKSVVLTGYMVPQGGMFSWYYGNSINELSIKFSKIVLEKTKAGHRKQITGLDDAQELAEAFMYVQRLPKHDIGAVLVTDKEYPMYVAFGLLRKILEEFSLKYATHRLSKSPTKDWCLQEESEKVLKIKETIQKYQKPQEADPVLRTKRKLDKTNLDLRQRLDSILDQGEDIDTLIQTCDDLTDNAKQFYSSAKKANKCCILL
mmetsp:Transcript_150/g.259  ORF Transcript_150/g.259 Transcript_150/m.259 type:complete len:217 (+) Transcript_150:101-751(+)